MVPVRVIPNLKASTVEEALGRKKSTHLSAFAFMLEETRQDLRRIADRDKAEERLAADPTRNYEGAHTVEGLLAKIVEQCAARLEAHRGRAEGEYAKDEVFRGLVVEMLAVKTMAVAKLRWWLEDRSQMIRYLQDFSLRKGYRGLQAYLRRGMPLGECSSRRDKALDLCKLRGLVQERVDEENVDGEARLVSAAADGVAAGDLKLLMAAGAQVVFSDSRAPLLAAAEFGQADAIQLLLEASANLESRGKVKDIYAECYFSLNCAKLLICSNPDTLFVLLLLFR
jgi:hypothetical protein